MIRIGIAGVGFMGMVHYLNYQKVRGAEVVALAECDRKKLSGDWRGIKGNFGPPGRRMDLAGIRRYRDTDQLVNDPDVDLIDICLPPALHAGVALAALRAGKHVFSEKPIALAPADARRMVETARQRDRILLVGHVLPYYPEYARVLDFVRSKKYGRLLGGNFKRIISTPLWLPKFFDPDVVGGPMLDLHIHDAHFIRLLFGMPKSVFTAGRMQGKVAGYFTTQFIYGEKQAVSVTATSGVIAQQGRSFTQGFEIHFEKATVLLDFAVLRDRPVLQPPFTVLDANGRVSTPKLGSADPLQAFQGELTDVVRSIRTGQPAAVLDGQLARDAVILCQKQNQSLRTGRLVKV